MKLYPSYSAEASDEYDHKQAAQLYIYIYLCSLIYSSPPEGLINHVNLSFQIGLIGTILRVIACTSTYSRKSTQNRLTHFCMLQQVHAQAKSGITQHLSGS